MDVTVQQLYAVIGKQTVDNWQLKELLALKEQELKRKDETIKLLLNEKTTVGKVTAPPERNGSAAELLSALTGAH